MRVLKFGSATIANATKIKYIASLIKNQQGNIVVLSSMKGVAEYLSDISKYYYNKNVEGAMEILNKLSKHYKSLIDDLFEHTANKAKAYTLLNEMQEYIKLFSEELFTLFEERALMAQGELMSANIMALYLDEQGIKTHILQALDYMRMDRSEAPDMIYIKENLQKQIEAAPNGVVYLTQGYICRNAFGEIDDLRKGGSDYTAAIVGAAIQAEEIQIWGDSDVMYNINPEYIEQTKIIKNLSFDEAAELAYFGTKILHPTCVLPAKLAGVPVRLLNTQKPEALGTFISNDTEESTVKAIGTKDNITTIKIKSGRMLLAHGFLRRIFEVFEKYQTSIDMLASSEIGVSLTIDDCRNLDKIVDELKSYGTVIVNKGMVIVSIVGDSIMKDREISASILDALKNIPVRMISYGGSDLNFSFLVEGKHKQMALKVLNEKLFN